MKYRHRHRYNKVASATAIAASALLYGCGGNSDTVATAAPTPNPAPSPVTKQASAATAIMSCTELSTKFMNPSTTISTVKNVDAGTLTLPGIETAMPEHCVITGRMNSRVSPVDGKTYAIGFEMRLPKNWNGRFFHQTNGGLDGSVVAAYGNILGGGPTTNGLLKGFAVLSSDAGHTSETTPGIGGGVFGLDPQARLDYGYNAVGQLTPMAKNLIKTYYGKAPDTSYIVGTSNGGRHVMVAASRYADQYDGFLAGSPGFNLPKAAVAQLWGAQQFAGISQTNPTTNRPDLRTSFSMADTKVVADSILKKCDALDGATDGIVFNMRSCQLAFNPESDVPTCSGAAASSCLTSAQKSVLAKVMAGPKNAANNPLYASLPWDTGISGSDWRTWKFDNSTGPRDPVAMAFVFTTPPQNPAVLTGAGNTVLDYALNFNLETDAPKIYATNGVYTESAMSFMTPPNVNTLPEMVAKGGKLLVVHGASDPVFSVNDTVQWYDQFFSNHGAKASDIARLFIVPGMNHSRGGPATDQYDMVDALVTWVEQGKAPSSIIAKARGNGAVPAASVNTEIPATWSPGRTRPLCPYPKYAKYNGSGDVESASSFSCVD